MKGRKPKLHVIAEAEGFPGKRRKPAPPSSPGDFDPPFELGEVARAEWDRIRTEAPWIQAPSSMLLAMRCVAFEDMMLARRDIKRRGRLIKTRNGSVKNPCLQVERENRAYILRADIELGLTPCSQQKVAAPQKPATDPLEDALCG